MSQSRVRGATGPDESEDEDYPEGPEPPADDDDEAGQAPRGDFMTAKRGSGRVARNLPGQGGKKLKKKKRKAAESAGPPTQKLPEHVESEEKKAEAPALLSDSGVVGNTTEVAFCFIFHTGGRPLGIAPNGDRTSTEKEKAKDCRRDKERRQRKALRCVEHACKKRDQNIGHGSHRSPEKENSGRGT